MHSQEKADYTAGQSFTFTMHSHIYGRSVVRHDGAFPVHRRSIAAGQLMSARYRTYTNQILEEAYTVKKKVFKKRLMGRYK